MDCFEILRKLQEDHSDISDHLETLRMLAVECNYKHIVELGTRWGYSTIAMLLAARETKGIVLSVDRDPCEEAHKRIAEYDLTNYWKFLQADALDNPDVLKLDGIDLLFVDLDHTYDETIHVLNNYAGKIVGGGAMAFHDTTSGTAVWEALNVFLKLSDDWKLYHWRNNNGFAVLKRT